MAAQELGLPIRYIMNEGYGLKQVHTLNEGRNDWDNKDYLNSYCKLKHPEYIKFKNFQSQFPCFGMESTKIILENSSQSYEKIEGKTVNVKYFQSGNLVIPNYNESVTIAKN